MLGWTEMNASVPSRENGKIKFLRYYPDAIRVDDQVTITVNSTNIGNTLGDFRLRLILSKDGIFFNSTCDFSLNVLEEDTCIFYYSPSQAGTYQLNAKLYNLTETKVWDSSSKNMTVASKIVSPTPPSGPPSAPSRPPVTPTVKSIEIIEYPPEINGTRGEMKMIPVKVKNTGNAALHDVKLIIKDLTFFTKISPDSLGLLSNTTQTFLVRLEIPKIADFKVYQFGVKAIGDNVSDTKTIKLRVMSRTLEDRIRSEIENLYQLIEINWKDLLELQTEGYNVTHIFETLDEARENLVIAEGYFEIGKYEDSERYLEYTRSKLEEVAIQISRVKSKRIILPAFTFEQGIIILILISVVIVLVVIIIIQRKKIFRAQEAVWAGLREKWKKPTNYTHLYPHYIIHRSIEKLKKKEESTK